MVVLCFEFKGGDLLFLYEHLRRCDAWLLCSEWIQAYQLLQNHQNEDKKKALTGKPVGASKVCNEFRGDSHSFHTKLLAFSAIENYWR